MQQKYYQIIEEEVPTPHTDPREQEKKQSLHQEAESSKRERVTSHNRRYEREFLKIPFRLSISGKEVSGFSVNLSPGGLRIISATALNAGTPLALQCSFGEICYLNISGRVAYCQSNGDRNYTVGIKFSALRDWEEKILTSAVQELKQSAATQEKSLLTMHVSEDTMALEAADFYMQTRTALVERPGAVRQSCVHAAKIVGWGSCLPPHEITNQNINTMLRMKGNKTRFGDVVGDLTGIKFRRYAGSKIYPSDLAAEASLRALKDAGVDPKDIDVIISCGVARDVEEPATACIIQEKLGACNAYVFDLANACNGFISAMDVLDSFIASGRCEIGLVAVGDVLSQYVTWDARSKKDLHMSSMSYTFGDGGGAAVMQRIKEGDEQGIRARWFLSDSSYWRVAVIPLMDTPRRLFKSNAAEIERAALKHVPTGVETILKMLDWDMSDVDLIIPHQVSSHIIENLFYKKLGWPTEKVFWSFPGHGNVGAASMPVALCEARREGRIKSGNKVLLVGGSGGFGAGVIGLVM